MYTYKPDICKVPIKVWSPENTIEAGALQQASNLAELPFLHKHVALMPDCHQGYGMPIGGVIGTLGVVIPNAVGVDIGCGMAVMKTTIKNIAPEQIKKVFGGSAECKGGIRALIPVGRGHHSKKQDESCMPKTISGGKIVREQYESALKQVGTLGGGNHFIELQEDKDGYLYVMIHSGSRNIGYKVAKYYNELAVELNEKWYTGVPKSHQLAFLPMESEEATRYLFEMDYCVQFAKKNRELIMSNIISVLDEHFVGVGFGETIDICHNYARMENHFGKNVMIHRKGAISAKYGELGIIPGSQGTKSYIVKGLGNHESFKSCSHGAGRVMSRTRAKEELNLEEEVRKMDAQGIVHGMRSVSHLDESASAYKDIDLVMENQKDLVGIVVELTPLGVIKG